MLHRVHTNAIEKGIKLLQEHAASGIESIWRVPIVGRVAAGSPLLAEEHLEGHLTIDPVLVGSSASAPAAGHFALRVQGMSM
jgi:repressor LexA